MSLAKQTLIENRNSTVLELNYLSLNAADYAGATWQMVH